MSPSSGGSASGTTTLPPRSPGSTIPALGAGESYRSPRGPAGAGASPDTVGLLTPACCLAKKASTGLGPILASGEDETEERRPPLCRKPSMGQR
jgi:hypothetical protein